MGISHYMQTARDPAVFSRQVQAMFGAVAPRYDFLNALLSCRRDRYWRKTAVDLLAPQARERILDVATGTADMAIEIASRRAEGLTVLGIDFSGPMLNRGNRKVRERQLAGTVTLHKASGEHLPFASAVFAGAVCAFGIRNFSDAGRGLREMLRVLKPGGRVVILEFSRPLHPVLGWMYRFYFKSVLPRIGKWISRHEDAYQYLPDSVSQFPMRADFVNLMQEAGFESVTRRDLTLGIVTLYKGIKPSERTEGL